MRDTLELAVVPAVSGLPEVRADWAIYDPAGDTSAELAKLGFSAPAVELGDDLAGVDVLVVGSRALEPNGQPLFTPDDVHRGLRVVVFEQTQDALRMLGFRTEDVVPRYAFPRVSDHPVLAGVAAADLTNWRGEGRLIPDRKHNDLPYPDQRLHWGNLGSVASVVIETPHQGSFTPILEAEFDLAYSPLLEWLHGAGLVLFVQLDLVGRVGLEPTAGVLIRNLVASLDAPADGSSQDRELVYVGSGGDEAELLRELGFALTEVDPVASPVMLRDLRGRIAVVGRGVPAGLPPAARRQVEAYVRMGGIVLLLPQTGKQLEQAEWPWPVTTDRRSLARAGLGPEPASGLLRGLGPQLLRWRTFLDLDVIRPDSLPAGAEHLLDGLLVKVPDGRGSWLLSQLDWRQLDAGGNNARRPRWNARKFYRQVLTNLGARTSRDTAATVSGSRAYAPMVDVPRWRASTEVEVVPYDFVFGTDGLTSRTLAGLSGVFRTELWPGTSEDGTDWGQVLEADADGFVSLTPVAAAQPGATGYLRTYLYTSQARRATFSVGAATWFMLKVNGEVVADQGTTGTWFHIARPTRGPAEVVTTARLEPGWNRLELLVTTSANAAWAPEFGAWAQVSDPGDLEVRAAAAEPADSPSGSGDELHAEPPFESLYTEGLPSSEDVYRHIYW